MRSRLIATISGAGLPYLDGISYRWGSSAQTLLLQLQHGDIQSIGNGIGASLVPQVSAEPSLSKYVVRIELPAVYWIGLNLHEQPFTDPRVRQALNYAVNRPQLQRVTYGTGTAWGLPFPRTLPDFHRTATPYTYDLERARALLRGRRLREAVVHAHLDRGRPESEYRADPPAAVRRGWCEDVDQHRLR